MITLTNGEVLFREQYGSNPNVRLYVKPPHQVVKFVMIEDDSDLSDIVGWFAKFFLPQGYPNSVSKDYLAYQIWDTAQAFCSTITGTLATQEVLKGMGVGNTQATPLAATVTWVIKDGCGHVGRILFAYTHGTQLDAYSKKWRLFADILNDAAMCIEIALPLFKNYVTFALCVSTMMKAIVGVAGGATRSAMTQHHAIRGNLADVSAKDSAQETAVNLIASFTALFILTTFGNSKLIFALMLVLHIVFNYFAVRSVCLRTLNEARYLKLIDAYLNREVVANPCEINKIEPIVVVIPGILDAEMCGFRIKIGCSAKNMLKKCPRPLHMKINNAVYAEKKYVLYPDVHSRIMYLFPKIDCGTSDILMGYFHAVLLSIAVSAINDVKLDVYKVVPNPRPFAKICHTLRASGWSRQHAEQYGGTLGLKFDPTRNLLTYIDKIATKEWEKVSASLKETGWDLSKHLLILDEWRYIDEVADNPNVIGPRSVRLNKPTIDPSNARQHKPQSKFDSDKSALDSSQHPKESQTLDKKNDGEGKDHLKKDSQDKDHNKTENENVEKYDDFFNFDMAYNNPWAELTGLRSRPTRYRPLRRDRVMAPKDRQE